MRRDSLLLMLACVLGCTAAAGATTFLVRPEGTGDFATIQAAIAGADWGDIVQLTDGRYAGPRNRDLSFHGKPMTVCSQSGNAQACIIDCGGSEADPHRGFIFQWAEGSGSIVRAITIEDA